MTPEEVVGKTYLDLFAKEPASGAVVKSARSLIASRRPFHHVVIHYRHKNGGDVYTEDGRKALLNEPSAAGFSPCWQ